jgi:hypothetical protein
MQVVASKIIQLRISVVGRERRPRIWLFLRLTRGGRPLLGKPVDLQRASYASILHP